MSITIKAGLDNSEVKQGLGEVRQELQKTDQAAKQTGDGALEQLHQEITEQIEDVKELASELRKADQAAEQVGSSASSSMGKASSSAKSAAKESNLLKGGVTALNSAFNLAKDAVEGISSAIDALAENGNPAAIDLKSSFGEFKDTLFQIADDPRFQNMLKSIADITRDDVIPALKSVADTALDASEYMADFFSSVSVSIGESVGLLDEGTSEILDQNQRIRDSARETADEDERSKSRQVGATQNLIDVTKELARIEQEKAAATRRSTLQEIDSQKQLQDLIDDAKQSLNDGELPEEKKAELLDIIRLSEQRIIELQRKAREEERAALADRKREQADLDKKRADAQEEESKAAKEDIEDADEEFDRIERNADAELRAIRQKRRAEQEAAEQKKQEEERAAADARARAAGMTKEVQQFGQDAWNQAGSRDAILNQLAQQRGQKRSTVERGIARGDISAEEIAKAQQANFGQILHNAQFQNGMNSDVIAALNEQGKNFDKIAQDQINQGNAVKAIQEEMKAQGMRFDRARGAKFGRQG